MLKPPGRGLDPFGYRGSWGPANLQPDLLQRLNALANEVSQRSELRGWFGFDFLVDRHGRWFFLEINPRWCASMELLAGERGATWLKAHMEVCQGRRVTTIPSIQPNGGIALKRILRYPRAITIPDHLDWQELLARFQPHRLADLPLSGSTVPAHHPFCTVILHGHKPQSLLTKSQRIQGELALALTSIRRLGGGT